MLMSVMLIKKHVFDKRKERSNNVGKTAVTFPHIFCEMLGVGITKLFIAVFN